MKWIFSFAAAAAGAGMLTAGETAYDRPGPYRVKSLEFPALVDTNRQNRSVPIKVLYPETGTNCPLVVMSHGGVGTWDAHLYQAEHLASHGYVVLCPEHVYSNNERIKHLMSRAGGRMRFKAALHAITKDPRSLLERPRDVSFTIDRAIAWNREHADLKGKIDTTRIAVMGHSYGAYTTLAVCGARPILDHLEPRVEPGTGLGPDLSDPRVTFGLAMSPQSPGGTYFGTNSYKTINRPLVCLTGSKDVQKSADNTSMPAETRWEVLRLLPPGKTYFLWLDNANHFCFADNPKAWLLPSRARADAQRITRAMTLLLSDHYLKQKPEAKSRLNGSYANTLCGRVITNVTWLTPWTPAPASRKTGETREGSLTHDGLTRTYRLYIPASRDEAVPAPLLMALHGGLGDAERMEQLTQRTFNALADRDGFVVVYPEGIERHWNDGRRNVSYRAHKEKIDDVGFLCALIDRLVSEWNADPARIYMTGASNGAMLTQRFAFEHAERVAAIAPVMGTIPLDLVGTCEPAAPVPVLIINGTDDPLVPWAGGEIGTQRRKIGKGVSIPEAVQFWATRNGCAAQPETALLPDACPEDGTRVKRDIYRARTGDADAVLYTIEGGGHTWPGGWQYLSERLVGRTCRDIDACELIWAFFRGHSRAGVVVPRAGTRGPARVRTRTPFGKSVD